MFDPDQARLLQAMGYVLLQRRQPPADAAADPATSTRAAASPGRAATAAGGRAPASAAGHAPLPGPSRPPHDAPAAALEPDDPATALWNALLAAAALDPERAEACGWRRVATGVAFAHHDAELWIDLQALRGDPGAKRALWRTLRALRRRERDRGR